MIAGRRSEKCGVFLAAELFKPAVICPTRTKNLGRVCATEIVQCPLPSTAGASAKRKPTRERDRRRKIERNKENKDVKRKAEKDIDREMKEIGEAYSETEKEKKREK